MALLDTLVFHYTHSENKAKQRVYLQKAGQSVPDTDADETAVEYFTRLLELVPETDPARSTSVLRLACAHHSWYLSCCVGRDGMGTGRGKVRC